MVVDRGVDALPAGVLQMMLELELGLTWGQANRLRVGIAVSRDRLGDIVSERRGVAFHVERADAGIRNLVEPEGAVRSFVGRLLEDTDTDLDECASCRSGVIAEWPLEFFDRARDRGVWARNHLWHDLPIARARIHSREPPVVVHVVRVLEPADDARPIETRAPKEPLADVRQVNEHF